MSKWTKIKDQTSNGISPLPFLFLWTEIFRKIEEIHFWFNTIWNIPRLKLRSKKDLENHWRCWQKYWKLQILEKIYATFFMQMAFFCILLALPCKISNCERVKNSILFQSKSFKKWSLPLDPLNGALRLPCSMFGERKKIKIHLSTQF